MTYEQINGARMFYEEAGAQNAQALVFLHGYPLDHSMWSAQMAAFSARFRCIAPDLRGHGRSELGDIAADRHSLGQLADDAITLLNHLRISSAIVCGLSMGGYVAFELWRRYSARISKLLLMDTRAPADSPEVKANRYKQADLVRAQGVAPLPDLMLPRLLAAGSRPRHDDALRRMILGCPADGVIATLRALAERPDSTATLTSIAVPTLIVVGAEDAITPPADARMMRDGIAGAHLAEIPNAGHMAPLEQPEAVNAAMGAFLA
jgi:3-oxoadipate enol-lactonase